MLFLRNSSKNNKNNKNYQITVAHINKISFLKLKINTKIKNILIKMNKMQIRNFQQKISKI